MSHGIVSFQFNSLISGSWDSFPTAETLKKQIAIAVLAQSELEGQTLGLYTPPDEIKDVRLTSAAQDQIMCMWHGHRKLGKQSPPPIPLNLFVYGFGQEAGHTWASLEVLPGLESWEAE